MKYAVQARVVFHDAGVRDNVLGFVEQHASGRGKWGTTTIAPVETTNDQVIPEVERGPAFDVELRYDGRADMDDLFVKLQDRLTSPPVTSHVKSWRLWIHECDHDVVPPTPCTIEQIASG